MSDKEHSRTHENDAVARLFQVNLEYNCSSCFTLIN